MACKYCDWCFSRSLGYVWKEVRKYKMTGLQEEGSYVGFYVSRNRGWADWRDGCWLSNGNQLNMGARVPVRRLCVREGVYRAVGAAVQKHRMLRFTYALRFAAMASLGFKCRTGPFKD